MKVQKNNSGDDASSNDVVGCALREFASGFVRIFTAMLLLSGKTAILPWRPVGLLLLLCLLPFMAAFAQVNPALANPKYASIVVDGNTGQVFHARHADKLRYPASLTKIMTLYVLFEEIEAGRLSLQTPIPISANSARQPKSKLGLKAGDNIPVEDAILSLVVKSANDIATAVAEHIASSESAFAKRMTKTAERLGLKDTRFRNASGLPDKQQYTTARDMALLARRIRLDFPQYYSYFGTSKFTFRGKHYSGHNRLVQNFRGADGIKTGYIRASGFNLASSVERNGGRLVAVVMGGRTAKSRDDHMASLLNRYLPGARRTPLRHTALPQGPLPNPLRLVRIEELQSEPLNILQGETIKTPEASNERAVQKMYSERNTGAILAEMMQVHGIPPDAPPMPKAPLRPGERISLATLLPSLIPPLPAGVPQDGFGSNTVGINTAESGDVGSGEIRLEEGDMIDTRDGSWSIQLEAHENPAQATEHLAHARDQGPDALQQAKAVILPFAPGDGRTLFWSGFHGFKTHQMADYACVNLRRQNIHCMVTSSIPAHSDP